MKKRTIALVTTIIVVFCSCQKEGTGQLADNQLRRIETAYKDFAVILSKAVCNEPELRAFLKEEALKKFDMDYDVFYPFVKDELVDGKRTFREIMVQYDAEGKLSTVEKNIPKMTILVPDWSWVSEKCFSVLNWDISSQIIAVCYGEGVEGHPLMVNGTDYAIIPYGGYVDLPVLILKSNERMVMYEAVKGSDSEYTFLDSAFDGSIAQKDTKSFDQTIIHELGGGGDGSDWVPKTKIHSSKVKDCYSMTSSVPGAVQRDYIYYGLNASSSTGYIDNTQYESIFRYKLAPEYNCYYESGDISFKSRTMGLTGYSDNALRSLSWIEGELEICFIVSAGFASPLYKFDNCSCSEAFAVTKVKETIHYNEQGQFVYRTYFADKSCLVGKWVYTDLPLFTWDVSTVPISYTVKVLEKDDGATIALSSSNTWQYTTNYTINNEIGGNLFGLTIKIGYGITTSESSSITSNTSITFTNNDDDLGTFVVQYINPIVEQDALSGALIYSYNTGKIKVTMLPVD